MIGFKLIGTEAVTARLKKMEGTSKAATLAGMWRAVIGLRNYIVTQKLNGQILKNRTGTLSRSIHAKAFFDAGNAQVVGQDGTNIVYAKTHEFGATIKARAAKYLKFRIEKGGPWIFRKEVTIPARPFLSTALAEKRADIFRELQTALASGLAK